MNEKDSGCSNEKTEVLRKLPVVAGFIIGTCFAMWTFWERSRPAACKFLQAPLFYILRFFDRHLPPSGPVALLLAVPAWFVYWGVLGALFGFIPRLAVCLLILSSSKSRNRNIDTREIAICATVTVAIFVILLACLLCSCFPPETNGDSGYHGP